MNTIYAPKQPAKNIPLVPKWHELFRIVRVIQSFSSVFPLATKNIDLELFLVWISEWINNPDITFYYKRQSRIDNFVSDMLCAVWKDKEFCYFLRDSEFMRTIIRHYFMYFYNVNYVTNKDIVDWKMVRSF